MSNIVYYNANRFKGTGKPDLVKWESVFSMINYCVSFIDRTNSIKIPIKTAIPPQLVLPQFDSNFKLTYEECCQSRVQEILCKQEQLDMPIRILYSGGIDSSLILVSFIKELGMAQAEKRIELSMTTEGIEENPWMWYNVIRPRNFKIFNAETHGTLWDQSKIIVNGEFNDQILGSDQYMSLVNWRGNRVLSQPWSEQLFVDFCQMKGISVDHSEMWAKLFLDHVKAAPCPVDTVADWWWWINFTCKWNAVYFRMLSYASNSQHINQDYLDNHLYGFFGSDDFQKWSMVDRTHKIQDSILSYKWHARDLVADYLKEDDYRKKLKKGSLWTLLVHKPACDVIDSSYTYHYGINANDWYNPDNSFV